MDQPTPPDNNNNNNNNNVDDDDYYLVSCRCESARAVSTLLSCLKHARGSSSSRSSTSSSLQPVTVYCSRRSLSFHVHSVLGGATQTVQASVDLPASLFSEYDVCRSSSRSRSSSTNNVNDPDHEDDDQESWRAGGEFCVNLTTVLECLHVLGSSSSSSSSNNNSNNTDPTKLFFSYNLTKDIFKLELLDERTGTLCTAAIPGMLPPNDDGGEYDDDDNNNNHTTNSNSLALAFRSAPIAARIIVRSEALRNVLVSELEAVQGASQVVVSLTPVTGWSVSAVGNWGAGLVRLPARGAHVVAVEFPKFQANPAAVAAPPPEWKYPMHSFLESMRGLEIAAETCITINTAGMMAIQHQVLPDAVLAEASAAAPSFIDFILCCCFEDDDIEEPKNEDEASVRATSSTFSQSTTAASIRSHAATTVSRASRRRVVSEIKEPISNSNNISNSMPDKDSDDDDPGSTARLFGSVASVASSSSQNVRRRVRPSHRNHNHHNPRDNSDEHDDDDDEPPLDVTALASPPRRRRRQRRRTNSHHNHREEEEDGECSSPELLYGPQD